ncbi:hypothetical protein Tco_0978478 [Tanacetum coccineum]|uniref:Uncharacterized protein n=1 Tax=Tanacetum coccineum TaxID=301880 RepID=A0ABQ5EN25_9ASTR
MEQMTSICDMVGQIMQKKEEERRIAEDQATKDRYWKIPICYDDDEDYTIAITPVLSTKEPVDFLIMEDEHLDTIPATESDKVIKSSVEELVLIPTFKYHSEIVVNSNDDDTSSDDNDFEGIKYVEASPPDLKIVSLEEVNNVDQEKEEFDLENILQIQDVILREKLLNINRLIGKIKSLNDNSTHNCVLKSPSLFPIPDSNSFFEKSDTSLSYSDNSLPEFESFSDHTEETSSGSTTTHANNSLPEYDSFHFEIEPDQGGLTSVVMEDILGEPRVHVPNVLPTHPTLMMDSDFIIRTFLPYFTYPVESPFLLSSGSEDTIFYPDISTFHFSSLKPVAHENPIVQRIENKAKNDGKVCGLGFHPERSWVRFMQEGYNPLHATSAATVVDTWQTQTRPKTRSSLNHNPPVDWRSTAIFRWSSGGPPPLTIVDRWSGGGSDDGEGIVSCHVAPLRW